MGLKLDFKERAGSSFMEYIIILGVVSAVLIGMNTYIKRGVQARLKDMTDYFISDNQRVVQINPIVSHSNTVSRATQYDEGFLGGGTRELVFESRQINAESTVTEIEPVFQPPVTSPPSPVINPPTPPGPTPTPTPPPQQGGN